MTGFGRASLETAKGRLVVEVQSVNRKHLDLLVFLPKEWSSFEVELRKWVAQSIHRGQVQLRVEFFPGEEGVKELLPSAKILDELKKGWEERAEKLGMSLDQITLPFLVEQYQMLPVKKQLSDESVYFEALRQVTSEALEKHKAMRLVEGKALSKEISKRVTLLAEELTVIEEKAPLSIERYREKLTKKLEETLPGFEENQERVFRETALLAEKLDITEELVRFRVHLQQFEKFLEEKGPVGKKIEFLLQEMMREINTIAAKSSEAMISTRVVKIKSELDRVREQIQNIE